MKRKRKNNFKNFGKKKIKNTIKTIEICAGAGGLSLGLSKHKQFEFILLNDIDRNCCKTLKHNHPDWNVIEKDVRSIELKSFENELDLLIGGLSCQSFSYAGLKKGLNDDRGKLVYEFERLIKESNPKMFLIENVKGMKSHNKGETLKQIIQLYESLNYNVQYKILNASHYGVPQKRERLFIIGTRKDIPNTFQFPKPTTLSNPPTLREALKNIPKDEKEEGFQYSLKKKQIFELVPEGGCWVDLPEKIQKEYMGDSFQKNKGGSRGIARRLAWDQPSLTILTSPSQKMTERIHPTETRPLTIRESARIQTFPDDYIFKGSKTSQYKQIGNAVPVQLAYHMGQSIIEFFNSISK